MASSAEFTPRAGLTLVSKYAHNYTGAKPGFLSFSAGEEFVLINAGNAEWWSARCIATGAIGYVPVNYLALPKPATMQSKAAPPPPRSLGSGSRPAPVAPPAAEKSTAVNSAASFSAWGAEPWFRGDLAKSSATRELDQKPAGHFLVREKPSEKAGEVLLSLSVKAKDGAVYHFKIARIKSGFTVVGGSQAPQPTLQALIAAYRSFDVTPECGPLVTPCLADSPLDAPLSREEHMAFLDGQIARIHSEASAAGRVYSITQHTALQNLIRQRQELASATAAAAPAPVSRPPTQLLRAAPPAPQRTNSQTQLLPPPPPPPLAADHNNSNPFFVAESQPPLPPPPPPSNAAADRRGSDPERRSSAGSAAARASAPGSPELVRRTSGSKHTRRAPPTPVLPTASASAATAAAQQPQHPLDIASLASVLDPALVQRLRDETGISFDNARTCALLVLGHLMATITDAATVAAIAHAVQASGEHGTAVGGADLERLNTVIYELTDMKNDAQQRSWSIYNDSEIIQEFLDEFIALVEGADPARVMHVVRTYQSVGQVGSYEIVETLVVYYQMETRTALRVVLLRLFFALGSIDPAIFRVLQNSVLPLELARDVQVPPASDDAAAESLRVSSLRLLVRVLTCGLPLPAAHHRLLNGDFAEFLLRLMAADDADETLVDCAVDLLLSLNLHHEAGAETARDEHSVMNALTRAPCTVFSERIVLLANRGIDPVPVTVLPGDAGPSPRFPHSVFKLLADIFASKVGVTGETFFFTNDLRVLVEVLIRELADRDSTDPLRADYLRVLGRLLAHSQYREAPHRAADVRKCLAATRDEENYDGSPAIAALKSAAGDILANFNSLMT